MPRNDRVPEVDREDKDLCELARRVEAVVARQFPATASFEERSRAAQRVMCDVLWLSEQERLEALVSEADQVVIGGARYRRLSQPSSAVYHGMWGAHLVKEPLYRHEGVRNGPTLKPLERRVGIVAGALLPDLAHATGYLAASETSREIEETLTTLGFRPPSRAVLETRGGQLGDDFVGAQDAVMAAVRADETVGDDVASVSVGLDRMAVRIDEPLEGAARDAALARREGRRYERTPPDPLTRAWRMAWVGSVTLYDREGEAIRTLRYGAAPEDAPQTLAQQLVADVRRVVECRPDAKVVCVQDGARDLDILRHLLREQLPEGIERHHVVDIQHLLGYLGTVVVTCEPQGDPHSMMSWYTHELLNHDDAIDRIFRQLRYKGKKLPRTDAARPARKAVADAIRYIRRRRPLMRYASLVANNLPVGSGATESSCAYFQLRIKRPGSHWSQRGVRRVMALRGLVSSGRWDASWSHMAASYRAEVTPATPA